MRIAQRKLAETVRELSKVSPRRYYLHNQIGGLGWRIECIHGYWELTLAGPKFDSGEFTFFLLSGEYGTV